MKPAQSATDKLSIFLSTACVIHCLALPVILVLLPSAVASFLSNEAFHLWMVIAIVPSSIFALSLGCKQHERYRFLLLGMVGLVLLVGAIIFGHDLFAGKGEQILTVVGSVCIVVAHWFNFRLCRKLNQNDQVSSCDCEQVKDA